MPTLDAHETLAVVAAIRERVEAEHDELFAAYQKTTRAVGKLCGKIEFAAYRHIHDEAVRLYRADTDRLEDVLNRLEEVERAIRTLAGLEAPAHDEDKGESDFNPEPLEK